MHKVEMSFVLLSKQEAHSGGLFIDDSNKNLRGRRGWFTPSFGKYVSMCHIVQEMFQLQSVDDWNR